MVRIACSPPRQRRSRSEYRVTTRSMTPRYSIFIAALAPVLTVIHQDPSSCTDPLRRTTTGIISNRRPITGTPASTSGSATPNLIPDTGTITDAHLAHAGATSRPSLLATAKREAAMRGLYARFFRGPVLGPDDDPRGRSVPGTAPSSSESSSLPSPVHQPIREQGPIPRETKKRKKRKTQNNVETREERKERKRLKKERMAAKVAKKAEKARAGVEVKEKKDRHDIDRKDKETWPRSEETSSLLRKTRKRARNSLVEEDREPAKRAEKQVGRRASPTNNEQQDSSYRPSTGNHADVTDALNTLLTTKKKRRKRKDTQP